MNDHIFYLFSISALVQPYILLRNLMRLNTDFTSVC